LAKAASLSQIICYIIPLPESKVTKISKKTSQHRVTYDQEIKKLARYYKLESPDALLNYVKKLRLAGKDMTDIPSE